MGTGAWFKTGWAPDPLFSLHRLHVPCKRRLPLVKAVLCEFALTNCLWPFLLRASSITSAAVLYVDLNSTNPTPPYPNRITAATNIQDAVDAANVGDQVLVNDGVYQNGGRTITGYSLTNRVRSSTMRFG